MRFTVRESRKIDTWVSEISKIYSENPEYKILNVPYIPVLFRDEVTLRLMMKHELVISSWGPLNQEKVSLLSEMPTQTIEILDGTVKETTNPSLYENNNNDEFPWFTTLLGISFVIIGYLRATGVI